ncbi:MAG: hypothetical protein LBF04_04110 [Prevotellaceae bacterium]|jgi:predicted  nucleic acid-binding Zn-ribbon protein|nr:hypothetical protein [Prevotellaceae bacterium]
MKKHITMTYIEVLEKRLKRKREQLSSIEDTLEQTVKNTVRQRYIELKSEIRELESCLDLAKVMFDGEENNKKETD